MKKRGSLSLWISEDTIEKWRSPKEHHFIGTPQQYSNDAILCMMALVELKCCESLGKEQQAELFNYLKVSQLPIGLLVNFRRGKLEWKRLESKETVDETILS